MKETGPGRFGDGQEQWQQGRGAAARDTGSSEGVLGTPTNEACERVTGASAGAKSYLGIALLAEIRGSTGAHVLNPAGFKSSLSQTG